VVKYISEARDLGLEILPPDVNESGYRFTVISDTKIRFGLGAVRNVGRSAIDSIIGARGKKNVESRTTGDSTLNVPRSTFLSLYDFAERVDLRLCNKRVFEALLHAGAFDNLGGHRAQFAAALDGAIQAASLAQAEVASGQGSLFGESSASKGAAVRPVLPNVAEMSEHERLTKEKEIIGFYISGHPLEPFRAEAEILATHAVSSLGTWHDQPMSLAVVVTGIKRQISRKSGNEFARLTIEDFSGSTEVLVFPEAWAAIAERVVVDVPVLLKGAYGRRDQNADNPTFIVESITRLAELRTTGQIAVAIDLAPDASISTGVLADIRAVVEAHPGSAPLEVRWRGADGQKARMRSASLKVSPASNALLELRALLGTERVQLVRSA
jgi:DNA polymerase-3 subunit alpha